MIVFAESNHNEEKLEEVQMNKNRFTSSYRWKSFQTERRGLSTRMNSMRYPSNVNSDVLKNHFQLEDELVKINCEQYIPALAQAGFLKDEVTLVGIIIFEISFRELLLGLRRRSSVPMACGFRERLVSEYSYLEIPYGQG